MFDQLSYFYYSDAKVMHPDHDIIEIGVDKLPIGDKYDFNCSACNQLLLRTSSLKLLQHTLPSRPDRLLLSASNVQKFKKRVKKSYITVGVDFTRDNSGSASGSPVYGMILPVMTMDMKRKTWSRYHL